MLRRRKHIIFGVGILRGNKTCVDVIEVPAMYTHTLISWPACIYETCSFYDRNLLTRVRDFRPFVAGHVAASISRYVYQCIVYIPKSIILIVFNMSLLGIYYIIKRAAKLWNSIIPSPNHMRAEVQNGLLSFRGYVYRNMDFF
jgi:hypothetical protein